MLDTFTLLIALTIIHILATVIMFAVWHINRSIPGVGYWAIGRLAITLALMVFTLQPQTELGLSVIVGNAILMFGLYFIVQGNFAFMTRPTTPLFPIIASFAVSLVGMAYWSMVEPNYTARTLMMTFALVVFDWYSFRALWPREEEELYFFGKLMAVVFFGHGIVQVLRAAISLGEWNAETYLDPALSTQLVLIAAIAMSTLTTMAHVAIIMEFLKKDLKRQAERDPLTGAYNRRAFHTLANHVFARGRREGGAISLVILDLDHFKSVNDSHGHAVGDKVLKRVVSLAHGVLRAEDVLVRLGGEEFAMMLPAATQNEALHIAERIRKAIEAESFRADDKTVKVTTSLGVTSLSVMGANDVIDDLIKQADIALYQAKVAGRNQVCVFAAT
ncbi:MAG TPA: GGDEF domain-containing protein [Magnetovibrio sp.]